MDSSAHQGAYDRGNTIFSPDGRLYQVEYAREAVERGSPSVGVVTDDGIVLAARKRIRSPLLEAGSVEKIHRVDDHLAIASAGHAADARQLVGVARQDGQRHRLRYGEPIDVESLAKHLADHIQEHTQSGGSRPYGAALLVAGVDPGVGTGAETPAGISGRARLYEVDPSGTPYGWRAVAVGDGGSDVRRFLEEQLADGADGTDRTAAHADEADTAANRGDLWWGTITALEALATTTEDDLTPATVDVWTIDSTVPIDSGSALCRRLSDDELEASLAETAA